MGTFFYSFIAMGAFFSVIGAALPMMRKEYMLNYQISGMLMSALAIGYLIAGATVNLIAGYLGKKRTYLIFSTFLLIGLGMMMITSNQKLLLLAASIAGLSRGCIDTFGNQAVSVAAEGNDMPINFLQACYSMGTCIAPLITMACGASWRIAFSIVMGFAVIAILLGVGLNFGQEERKQTERKKKEKADLSFFKNRLFWQCTIFLTCYMSVEDALIGWIVTYFADSGVVSRGTAQLLASVLYAMIMIGRLITSGLATRFKADHLLIVMSGSVVLWFSLLVFSHTMVFMVAGLVGLGLFMAGIYGAALANGSELIEKYPMCMGMFITIAGVGATVLPAVVGVVANRAGVRSGMKVIYIVIIIMVVNAVLNLKRERKKLPKN